MLKSTIAPATDGYIGNCVQRTLSPAVSGYLCLLPTGGGGGKGKGGLQDPREYTYRPRKEDLLRAQILNEDDEILSIIMAATETIQ